MVADRGAREVGTEPLHEHVPAELQVCETRV
jgi:hypothetical protein